MIQIRNLNKTYDRGSRSANHALRDISFDLPETGFVCILGASGCGKTSLLNAIGGLDAFDSGTLSTGGITVNRYGTNVYEAERNRSFGYIFQNYYLLQDHSVGYNVYLGLHNLALSHEEKLSRVRDALRSVDMERFIRRKVSDLSGGQQQRIAIARALARKPRVIFADEPTGNLDEANTMNICTLLRRISRTSLVVMVTHEERIARFFADRIITLEAGRILNDGTAWQRDAMAMDNGKVLYAGDYAETNVNTEGIRLRLLQEEDAAPVELTVLAMKDRIVIKLTDGRTISCGTTRESPELKEGPRPILTLEALDQTGCPPTADARDLPTPLSRPGQGIGFADMFRQARKLMGGKGLKIAGMRIFLILLTVLTILTVGDYITVASVNKEDFITSHSAMLELRVEQGTTLRTDTGILQSQYDYRDYLKASGLEFSFVPHISMPGSYTITLFDQMEDVSIRLGGFSYVPLECFDTSSLVSGRLPEAPDEIVVDRWVLENAVKEDGIIQNSIADPSYFLECRLEYTKKNITPKIVGICDSGEPAIYLSKTALISLGVGGKDVISLSDLQRQYPGQYDDLTLDRNSCIVITNNAGNAFAGQIGGLFRVTTRTLLTIQSTLRLSDCYADVVVADECIDRILEDLIDSHYHLYCRDKQAMLDYIALRSSGPEKQGYVVVQAMDHYSEKMATYTQAATVRADGRTIVTLTIMALAMVMLYLLCRAQAQERIGMMAVYRLLGIPKRKLGIIFSMETVLSSLVTALPAAVLTFGAVQLLNRIEEMDFSMILPLWAAAAVYGAILVYHLVVSLLPLRRLLKLPPAQLAAKYDM